MAERQRRSVRLAGHDYASGGAYFVTICAFEREELFLQTDLAAIIHGEWTALPQRFSGVSLDEFVVMPNHVHFIVQLVGAPLAAP